MNVTTSLDVLRTTPWPVDGLESVNHCPVCGETEREILHADLVDNVFRVAPGKWSLWECAKCRSAYVDPRPTCDTIHLAYSSYFTHREAATQDDYAFLSPFRKLRRRLANGYANWRYSGCAMPSSSFGVLAALAMPNMKSAVDIQYRHMPRIPKDGGQLLDVGCGNGSFLRLARSCGWGVTGLDPDPKAVTNAAKQGLTVHRGGIEYFEGKTGLFDVITLNHVIEHVHDPVKVLKICYALLKPGGQLWLETPNIHSLGHARFQNNWFDLDPPRHLVLFNRHSLSQAFISAGFSVPHDRARPCPCVGRFKKSYAMEHGQSGLQALETPKVLQWQATITAYVEVFLPSRREFLTVAVRKEER